MKQIEGVAAILIANKKIAAFRRNHGTFAGYYEFVGGKIEAKETKEEALIRECIEELELDITIHQPFKTINYDYDDFSLTLHTFICSPNHDRMILSVHDDVVWVDETSIEALNWLPADRVIMDDLKQLCITLKTKGTQSHA